MKKVGIIIPAGGNGSRMVTNAAVEKDPNADNGTPKQLMLLGGRPVLARAIEAFRCVAQFAEIVVALPADRFDQWVRLAAEYNVPAHNICEGGATRFRSIKNALRELTSECEYIAVHDAARPLVSGELIVRTLDVARKHGSAIPVVPLVDSLRRVTENGSWPENRDSLRGVQTPQIFRADILRTACERAVGDDFPDDATVVESVGYTVMLCTGERRNMKITTPEDLIIAESLLEK
jgi:2-C-methyl-D-erythritol 4-phosphate cytidylyltransferase